jgi:hypothetical protein
MRASPPLSREGATSGGFSSHHQAVMDEELGRTARRATDDRQQPGDLLARNQAQCSALGTRQHGPKRIVSFTDTACVLQHEDRARQHLFRNPLAQDVQFSLPPLGPTYVEPNFPAIGSRTDLSIERDLEQLPLLSPTPTEPLQQNHVTRFGCAARRVEERCQPVHYIARCEVLPQVQIQTT